jgi:hypothetical protein
LKRRIIFVKPATFQLAMLLLNLAERPVTVQSAPMQKSSFTLDTALTSHEAMLPHVVLAVVVGSSIQSKTAVSTLLSVM